MERDVCLRIPSSSSAPLDSKESSSEALHFDTDSAIFSTSFMVPITPGTSHRSSKRTTSDTKNVDREKMLSGLSRSRKPKTCSLKNIQHKQAKRKFSQTAQRYMENQPKEFMMQDCEFLKAGVVSNVSVHILPLKKAIFLIYLQEVKGW